MQPRGIVHALAARWRGQIAAVALAGAPTGRWSRTSDCPPEGTLEITRVASRAGLRRFDRRGRDVPVNAASALVAHLIDLLPTSGRGAPGCRLITYQLSSEDGAIYRALVARGLRPVALSRHAQAGGARTRVALPGERSAGKPAPPPPPRTGTSSNHHRVGARPPSPPSPPETKTNLTPETSWPNQPPSASPPPPRSTDRASSLSPAKPCKPPPPAASTAPPSQPEAASPATSLAFSQAAPTPPSPSPPPPTTPATCSASTSAPPSAASTASPHPKPPPLAPGEELGFITEAPTVLLLVVNELSEADQTARLDSAAAHVIRARLTRNAGFTATGVMNINLLWSTASHVLEATSNAPPEPSRSKPSIPASRATPATTGASASSGCDGAYFSGPANRLTGDAALEQLLPGQWSTPRRVSHDDLLAVLSPPVRVGCPTVIAEHELLPITEAQLLATASAPTTPPPTQPAGAIPWATFSDYSVNAA
ncbi:MAG: hypothetical protein IPK80_15870 [Nannocystis sp.]|nr:hypothetical protein [Nannocystis sp.]